jgi:hypothetical protein
MKSRVMVMIAHYRRVSVLSRTIAGVFVIAILYAVSLYSVREAGTVFFARRPLLLPIFICGWSLGLFLFYIMAIVTKRVLFENGKALWMEGGQVIFLHKWNFAVACRDIVNVTIGTYGRFSRTGIFLWMRDGTKKVVPTGSLAEPQGVIISRLKECIPAA